MRMHLVSLLLKHLLRRCILEIDLPIDHVDVGSDKVLLRPIAFDRLPVRINRVIAAIGYYLIMLLHELRPVVIQIMLHEFEVVLGDVAVAGADRYWLELPLGLFGAVYVEIGLTRPLTEVRIAPIHLLNSYLLEVRLPRPPGLHRLVEVVPLLHENLWHFHEAFEVLGLVEVH